jgi:multiple sugar transport system permease protein
MKETTPRPEQRPRPALLPAGGARRSRSRRRPKFMRQRQFLAYLLLAPLILFIAVLTLYPTAVTTVEAFFNVNYLNPQHGFAGLQNFRAAFATPAIRASMVNTLFYTAFGTVLTTFLGVVIALLLRNYSRWRAPILALVILPWALPPAIEALLWANIYDPSFGKLNGALTTLHVIHSYQVWLGGNRWLALALTELVQVWQATPLAVLIILSALQLIPNELYEAARIDGAGPWNGLLRITLPLIRPGITVAAVATLTTAMNIFDQPYILTGDASSTASVGIQTYEVTFQELNFGEGYALSLILTVATALAALAVLRLVYRRVEF